MAPGSVLVAEDDVLIALALEDQLRQHGWPVVEQVGSVAAGLAVVASKPPALALVDFQLADGWATSLLEALAAAAVPFLILTGHPCDGLPCPVPREARCLSKPWGEQQLRAALDRLLAA
jgi:DNA-binding response OmpR family regulator